MLLLGAAPGSLPLLMVYPVRPVPVQRRPAFHAEGDGTGRSEVGEVIGHHNKIKYHPLEGAVIVTVRIVPGRPVNSGSARLGGCGGAGASRSGAVISQVFAEAVSVTVSPVGMRLRGKLEFDVSSESRGAPVANEVPLRRPLVQPPLMVHPVWLVIDDVAAGLQEMTPCLSLSSA